MDSPILWQALIGLFSIAAIAFAIMGGRVWRIPTIVTVVGLLIGIVTFFVLSALTLKTHASWRSLYNKHDSDLAKALADQKLLREGQPRTAGEEAALPDADAPQVEAPEGDVAAAETVQEGLARGNRQLRYDLAAIREDRGKTWYGTGKLSLPTAEVTIAQPADVSHIVANMPLYIFQGDKPDGAYLGEFKVTGIDGKTVKLALTEALTPQQQQRLTGKDGEWQVRSIMPVDNEQVFAGLSLAQMKELLPQAASGLDAAAYEALLNEYISDGKPAKDEKSDRAYSVVKITKETEMTVKNEKGEDEKRKLFTKDEILLDAAKAKELVDAGSGEVVKIVYVRPLRNYENTFRTLGLRIRRLLDRSAQVTAQTAAVVAATKEANEIRMVSLAKEETALAADKEKMLFEREVVKTYLASLKAQHDDMMVSIQKQFAQNNRLAGEIASLQLKLAGKKPAETAQAASK